jgi:hypothetical protein
MRNTAVRRVHALRTTVLVLLVSCAAPLDGEPPAGAVPTKPAVSGFARVDGKELRLAHGYLLRAPDAFKASQQNAVVLLTPQPLDPKKLDAAATFAAALDLSPQRVVLEIEPDRSVKLWICHDGFGAGKCFITPLAPFDWKPGVVEEKRVSGSVKSFAGKEETVLETFRLYYEVEFDAAGGRALATRR